MIEFNDKYINNEPFFKLVFNKVYTLLLVDDFKVYTIVVYNVNQNKQLCSCEYSTMKEFHDQWIIEDLDFKQFDGVRIDIINDLHKMFRNYKIDKILG